MNLQEFKSKYQKKEPQHFTHQVPEDVLVSILVQTYNQENYIQECLDSILAQKTNFKFEILIGEDNSRDNNREICISYAKKFPDKIRLFLHHDENKIKVNGKINSRFNYMYNLFSANGKYFAFCDGDDYWIDENKLQTQFDLLEQNPPYQFCFHPAQLQMDKGEILEKKAGEFGDKIRFMTAEKMVKLDASSSPTPSMFFSKKVLERIPEFIMESPGAHIHMQNLCSIPHGAIYCPNAMSVHRRKSSNSVMEKVNTDGKFFYDWKSRTFDILLKMKKLYPEYSQSIESHINTYIYYFLTSDKVSFMHKMAFLRYYSPKDSFRFFRKYLGKKIKN